jgi:putative transposase
VDALVIKSEDMLWIDNSLSNHIHLLVHDDGRRDIIPSSLSLVESRVAQEYNQRKARPGAYWGDRYQATAVESGRHFLNCLIYIDLNMVRAGVVDHPCHWPFCGFYELRKQKQRYTLINMDRLLELVDIKSREEFWDFYTDLINRSLAQGSFLRRDSKWTEAIAVGSRVYVEGVHKKLGITSARTKITEIDQGFVLREAHKPYTCGFTPKSTFLR